MPDSQCQLPTTSDIVHSSLNFQYFAKNSSCSLIYNILLPNLASFTNCKMPFRADLKGLVSLNRIKI